MTDAIMRIKCVTSPAIKIYDLDITVEYNEVIEMTVATFLQSYNTQQLVARKLLEVVSEAGTTPIIVQTTDVNQHTFMLNPNVVKFEALNSELQDMVSVPPANYFWVKDPHFTTHLDRTITFDEAYLLYRGLKFHSNANTLGPATEDSILVAVTDNSLLTATYSLHPIDYDLEVNELIVGSYDYADNELYVPKGISEEAKDVSFDPSTLFISAIDVQTAIAQTTQAMLGDGVMMASLLAAPTFIKYYDSAVAPTVNDDALSGFTKRSRWYHDDGVGTQDEYVCFDATAGAAVWKKVT